jgi:hypothetical protein
MRQNAPRGDVVGFLQETRQEIQLSIFFSAILLGKESSLTLTLGM